MRKNKDNSSSISVSNIQIPSGLIKASNPAGSALKTQAELLIMSYLMTKVANDKALCVSVTMSELSELLKASDVTVLRIINELRDRNILTYKTHRGGAGSCKFITIEHKEIIKLYRASSYKKEAKEHEIRERDDFYFNISEACYNLNLDELRNNTDRISKDSVDLMYAVYITVSYMSRTATTILRWSPSTYGYMVKSVMATLKQRGSEVDYNIMSSMIHDFKTKTASTTDALKILRHKLLESSPSTNGFTGFDTWYLTVGKKVENLLKDVHVLERI